MGGAHGARLPLRLACNAGHGFPSIVSLWFVREGDTLWCATHRDAWVAKQFAEDNRAGYEIAVNEPPYCGVRGRAEVTLVDARGPEILQLAADKYLGNSNASLRDWLLARADEEVALRVRLLTRSVWDYGHRMERVPG